MIGIGIVAGSTCPGRNGGQVAGWVLELATRRAGDKAVFDVLDLEEFGLPLLDEMVPAFLAPGSNPHTVRWAQRAGSCDGYIFVTPEYNGGPRRPCRTPSATSTRSGRERPSPMSATASSAP